MQADIHTVVGHLVALLFVAEDPLPVKSAAEILELDTASLEAAVEALREDPPPGLVLQRHGDRVMLSTAPASTIFVERLLGRPETTRLSRAALEVLALVAYRQPITRSEIEAVRGVNSDSPVATLIARGLIEEVGRRQGPGNPALLGTAPQFLRYVGISTLDELPALQSLAPNGSPNGHHEDEFQLSR